MSANSRIQHLEQLLQRKTTGKTVATAPWREAFTSDVNSTKPSTFTLSSLRQVSPSVSVPRARTVAYRGMWASLQPNSKNPASLNPGMYQTDLPTITTDVRTEKVLEMFPASHQSSKGGPVEAVFWAAGSMTQWRLRGRVYMIGPDIDSEHAAPVRDDLTPYMRRVAYGEGSMESADERWSWSRELTAHFGNLSPFVRGTFRNPPPGTPLTKEPEEGLGLGQKVEDLQDGIARRNFRVLVIVPDEVDRVDLSDHEKARRWNYKLEGETWLENEVWP